MPRRSRTAVARWVGVAAIAVVSSACEIAPRAEPPTPLTIATGSTSGVYFPLGKGLARIYSSRVPGVLANAIPSGASPFNVGALQDGTADVAFVLGDVAYRAYAEGSWLSATPHRRLRSMAVLYSNALHFVVLPTSRIRNLRDLAGMRVGIGVGASILRRSQSVDVLLEAHGVNPATVETSMLSFEEIIVGLGTKTLDVGVISAGYPVPTVETAARSGLRFLEVRQDALERVRENYPFFLPVSIPPNTYSGQPEAIHTVGMDNLLLCRQGLDEELVYRLTKALFEALPELALAHPSARFINPDHAAATPIPLHAGAARYYRERELLLY